MWNEDNITINNNLTSILWTDSLMYLHIIWCLIMDISIYLRDIWDLFGTNLNLIFYMIISINLNNTYPNSVKRWWHRHRQITAHYIIFTFVSYWHFSSEDYEGFRPRNAKVPARSVFWPTWLINVFTDDYVRLAPPLLPRSSPLAARARRLLRKIRSPFTAICRVPHGKRDPPCRQTPCLSPQRPRFADKLGADVAPESNSPDGTAERSHNVNMCRPSITTGAGRRRAAVAEGALAARESRRRGPGPGGRWLRMYNDESAFNNRLIFYTFYTCCVTTLPTARGCASRNLNQSFPHDRVATVCRRRRLEELWLFIQRSNAYEYYLASDSQGLNESPVKYGGEERMWFSSSPLHQDLSTSAVFSVRGF